MPAHAAALEKVTRCVLLHYFKHCANYHLGCTLNVCSCLMQLQRKLSLGMPSRTEITAGAQCVSFQCQQETDAHKGKLGVTLQDTAAFHTMNLLMFV